MTALKVIFVGLGISYFLSSSVRSQPITPNIPLIPTDIPQQILQNNPITPPATGDQNLQPNLGSDQISEIIRFAISTTALRYPFLANPSDRLTFTPNIFAPTQVENYFDSDIRFAPQNPIIAKFTYGFFPKDEQFYWVLPNNRIVFETQGFQAGIIQQGLGRDITIQTATAFSRALSGTQTVTTLPENFSTITKGQNPAAFTIQSTAAQITNPEGAIAPPIILNTGIDFSSSKVTIIKTDVGTTNSSQGGGASFSFLEPDNTPQILQGFPTNNLQSLFSNGAIPLTLGAIIPEANLLGLGLSFNNVSTTSNTLGGTTSIPGVKTLQPDQFDNQDLLKILTNPFLRQTEREFYYLNSLFWSDLGIRPPLVRILRSETSSSWQRLYLSRPVNQSLISYDPTEIKAVYSNRFINLGASLSYASDRQVFNWQQSLNGSLGMLLGGIFIVADLQNLQEQVDTAKKLRDEKAKFTPLVTIATSAQRQQINQRLNSSLFYSSLVSGLEQVSGNLTFASRITPNDSELWQVRTGLYRRTVQFLEANIDPAIVGENVVSLLRTSVDTFGPLTFIGTQIPRSETGLASNVAFASEVVLTAPDGQQFVQSFNSADFRNNFDPPFVTIPAGINRFKLAFDRIEISRSDRQVGRFFNYLGYVSLPSVELSWTGSNDGFNYGISSGVWMNTAPNNAGNVANNNLGIVEPAIGMYANAIAVWSFTQVDRDEKNNPTAITTTSPVIRLNWNSGTNINNSSTANFSYTFSRQAIGGIGFSLTPGILIANEGSRLRNISFIQGSLDVGSGLRFRTSLELDQNLFCTLEGTQQIDPSWSLGIFFKNFREFNVGVDTRAIATNYGVSVKYQILGSPATIETQIGMSNDNIEVRIKGNFRFQF